MMNKVVVMVQEMANRYAASGDMMRRDEIYETLRSLSFLDKKLYFDYEPSLPPNPGYWKRLTDWLEEFSSEADKETALTLAAELFFVGKKEILAMHRVAYLGLIRRWLINQSGLDLMDADLSSRLEDISSRTWFCPITDSMKINTFFHANNIPSRINHRPDFLSLCEFGSTSRILEYIERMEIETIVLLEDFIASGQQVSKAIVFASKLRPSKPIPVLIVPLVLCPNASIRFAKLDLPDHVKIEPVLRLEKKNFVFENGNVSATYDTFRDLAIKTYEKVCGGTPALGIMKPYHPLGFNRTGGLVVLGTNTPDNTLPLVHWKSDTWEPLFPRNPRV